MTACTMQRAFVIRSLIGMQIRTSILFGNGKEGPVDSAVPGLTAQSSRLYTAGCLGEAAW